MKIRTVLIGVLFAISPVAAFSNDSVPERTRLDTNREVIQTFAQVYMEQKDYARTESLLTGYLQEDNGDGSLWVMLGQSQMAANHFAQACYAFKSASEAFKQKNDQTYALYLFADCLNRGNMQNEAMRVLSEISKSAGGVADVASRTLEMFRTGELRQGQPLPPYVESTRGMLRVSAAFGVGYDTNVLLLDEVVAANVPAKNRGSLFLNPAAQVGYLGKLWGKNFDSRYLVSFTDYTSAETKSFNSLYQRADFLWGSGEQRWGVFGETLFLNRDPFRLYDWMGGVSWNQRRKLSRNEFFDLEIPIRYQAYPLDSDGLAANDRKGEGIQIRGRYRNMTSDHTMILAQVAIDTQVTSGSNYRETQLLLPFYWTFELPGLRSVGLVNSVQAEADGQWYWSSDVKRKDLNLRAGTGLIRRWGKGWNTTLDYTHYKNFSNVDAAKYSKDTFLLMVSHDFL